MGFPVSDMACSIVRQLEILFCNDEGRGIDINDCYLSSRSHKHSSQRAAAAAYQKNPAGPGLRNKPEDRMNIGREAYAVTVRFTLAAAALFISNRARRF